MIDPTTEQLIRLADVPKLKWLPTRRGGKRLHLSTVYRWEQQGLRGVRLEIVQAGGTRCTTEAALLRFFDSLSNVTADPSQWKPRRRELAIARKELERARI